MAQKYNRWLILLAAIVINICIGSAYAWSVFATPLGKLFGWSAPVVAMAFTVNNAISPIPMILGGFIQDRKGAKYNTIIGGILFGLGLILTAYVQTPTQLYITYGVIAGLGVGIAYSGTIANTVKFFPDKRGLAAGLATAGYGSGATIVAPIASSLIINQGVLTTFKLLGVVFLTIILLGSIFIKRAPVGYKPEGWEPKAQVNLAKPAAIDKKWTEMLQDPRWYVLACMFVVGTLSGLMIIAHASPIGQEIFKLTPQVAALYVSLIAIANTLGRIVWGWVSDKIGRYNTLTILYAVAAAMLFVLANVTTPFGFAISAMGIGLCYGGAMGIFPSIVSENYGNKNFGVNYGITFAAFGIAAFYGPQIAAKVKMANHGNYSQAFYIALALSLVGIILTTIYRMLDKRVKSAESSKLAGNVAK